MAKTCLLAALLLLTACAGAPPSGGQSPCSGGENSRECQAYRYGNAP